MSEYVGYIEEQFRKHVNPANSEPMERYMKNRFSYYGIKSPERNQLQRDIIKSIGLPEYSELENVITELWSSEFRELHYFAMDLVFRSRKHFGNDTINFIEFLITNNSWWDTVDYIASNLVGHYFKLFPENIPLYNEKWLDSNNMWLQRTTLIFQLKYKSETDFNLICQNILSLLGSKEFFINKAIGWSLREYSKTNAKAVIKFVEKTDLANLSRTEALKWLKNKNKI